MPKLQDSLAYAPRGLRAERAAAYMGMSKTKFLQLVEDDKLPKPLTIEGVKIWDRLDLDAAFDTLKEVDASDRANTFDAVLGMK